MIIISNRINKPKMTARELIDKLRDEKGIKFSIMNDTDAVLYLADKNNYLRTASYRKNYDKHISGENVGKYINLEFSYLTELSTIDMHLRTLLLSMCIDIEHDLKVKMIAAIETNPLENGYSIVDEFLVNHPDTLHSVEKKADSIFTGELIEKYFHLCNVFDIGTNRINTRILSIDCPAWVFVEIISFKDLIQFIDFYENKYHVTLQPVKSIMNPVRSLRNACAHNNCLLNSMRPQNTQPPAAISSFVKTIPTVFKEERKNKLSCRPIFEIVCLLYAYNNVVSENVRISGLLQLQEFVNGRLIKHKDYFSGNQIISTSFEFLQKVVDNLA